MRWILCGKNDAAVACLEHLVARGDRVLCVCVRGDDGVDRWQRSLGGAAQRYDVSTLLPGRINEPAPIAELAAFRADALLSVQYDQILRAPLFDRIGCPCLNLHFALLPRHRGVAPISWAVFEGDREAGVTLHHMVVDIDAGDIVARKAVPIGPEATARDVYDAVSEACVTLFRETCPFPESLLSRRLAQDPEQASYHKNGDFDFAQRRVDWARPADELQRWLRAMIFPPMQHPEIGHRDRNWEVTSVGGILGPPSPFAPGTVLETGQDGVEVACAGGTLRIAGLVDPARPSASGQDLFEEIAVGDRLA